MDQGGQLSIAEIVHSRVKIGNSKQIKLWLYTKYLLAVSILLETFSLRCFDNEWKMLCYNFPIV